MIAQPVPKTEELQGKINSLAAKGRKLSDFEIRLLKKEADKLKNIVDYAHYYDFLGQVACLENDRVNLVRYYENALRNAFNNYHVRYDYASFLANIGLIFQAETQAKSLVEIFVDDIEAVRLLGSISYRTCKFRQTLLLSEKLENYETSRNYHLILNAISIFNNAELNDDEAQQLCKLAYSLLEIKNLYYSGIDLEIIDDCVFYTIYVDSPIEDIAEINWELAGIFADNVEDMRSDVLLFEYSSVAVLEEKQQ